jgi:hypothetical protein
MSNVDHSFSKFRFVVDIGTLVSNMLLGLKNMKFGDVPLTKAFYFYETKSMDALFSWYIEKTYNPFY